MPGPGTVSIPPSYLPPPQSAFRKPKGGKGGKPTKPSKPSKPKAEKPPKPVKPEKPKTETVKDRLKKTVADTGKRIKDAMKNQKTGESSRERERRVKEDQELRKAAKKQLKK